ncbi:MAG: 2-dehydropantoate 2-reductase [Bacilli bacterium]|nr:2-dehydropantoate 2-reductase [Bacilli bacterium]
MNVAIYGAGGMGTVLGAYITKAGYTIDLINRNKEHVAALKLFGAKIIGKINFTQNVSALLPEEMTKKYDIILLMTKQRHNTEIVTSLLPYLSDNGVICTMQNGLPEPSVADVIGKDRTIGCTMSWGATFIGKGVSELTSEPSRDVLTFNIGKYGNNDEALFSYIVELLNTMGDVTIEENFSGARWSKLLVNSAFSGLSVVTGATFGDIAKNKISRQLALEAIKECIDVAKALHIKIEPIQGKDVVKLMDYHNNFKKRLSLFILPIAMKKHYQIKSSMLRDIERGLPCEIDAINGVVSEFGKKACVETPINNKIISIVHQIENKELTSNWNNISLF